MSVEPFKAYTAILFNEAQVARFVLTDGQRLALVARGQPVTIHDVGSGGVAFSATLLPGASWPVAVCVVDLSHAAAWEALPAAAVNRIIDHCCAIAANWHRPAGATLN